LGTGKETAQLLGFGDSNCTGASSLKMMFVAVVITNMLNHLSISIPVQDNRVAVQMCALVEVINAELFSVDT
jgi:hypothetical protein